MHNNMQNEDVGIGFLSSKVDRAIYHPRTLHFSMYAVFYSCKQFNAAIVLHYTHVYSSKL